MARHPQNTSDPAYEDRIILFIDFLAFKEIVDETESDREALRRLLHAMDALAEIGRDTSIQSQRVSQFSDSIVVSYRIDEVSGVFWLLMEMAWAVIDLANRGYLLRGAVTFGPLFHSEHHVVGPAMVKAYLMESKQAKYPRVIIDPALLKIARRNRAEQHSPAEEAAYVKHFMRRDDDGLFFFDYVSWKAVVEHAGADDDAYGPYLARLSAQIERGLNHKDPGVVEKYLWLYRHYRASIDSFAKLPAGHPYRRQSPENCAVIEALPKFAQRVRAGKAKVAAATAKRAAAAAAVAAMDQPAKAGAPKRSRRAV